MSAPYPPIATRLEAWSAAPPPAPERLELLNQLARWIRERGEARLPADLLFVCTHNSRRSHMAALWARAAALHTGLTHVRAGSGGTEATAFHANAIRALRNHGFAIEISGELAEPGNPVLLARAGPDETPMRCFSKVWDHAENPDRGFAAVMVCSEADEACPHVAGAELRIALPFRDPKRGDGGADEAAIYAEASRLIGTEMLLLLRLALSADASG